MQASFCTEKARLSTKRGRQEGLKEIEVGPPAAKRHVGKQKPVVVDDSKEGSSKRKKVVVSPIRMMVKMNLIGLPGR